MRREHFGFWILHGGLIARALLLSVLLLHPSASLLAEEDEPVPAPRAAGVRITFLPPPMEGTLSLGIYDAKGKLVRVLAHEATEKDFTIGLNGYITSWDGRDDAGKPAPSGTYSASGFAVGALEVEGVAMHGNEWLTAEDSPRLRQVLAGALFHAGAAGEAARRGMTFIAETVEGKRVELSFDEAGKPAAPKIFPDDTEGRVPAPVSGLTLREGKLYLHEGDAEPLALAGLGSIIAAFRLPEKLTANGAKSPDGIWVVDRTEEGTAVKQFSTTGEFQRRLKIDPADPQPTRIAASPFAPEILLLEENAQRQRVRVLALEKPAGTASAGEAPLVSVWKTVFSKTILKSETFASIADKIGRPKPFASEEKFSVKLLPNPLLQDASTTLEVALGFDATGCFLRAPDGLPLHHLTETPGLKWAVMGREGSGKQLTVFQSDGAVVEEFKVRKIANMMAFDAGEYEWAEKK